MPLSIPSSSPPCFSCKNDAARIRDYRASDRDAFERFNRAWLEKYFSVEPIDAEMFADPQVKHLQMAHPVKSPKLGDIELIGQAINMSRTPFEMKSATPEQGEHTDAILKEFGYDAAAIADFRKRGVV